MASLLTVRVPIDAPPAGATMPAATVTKSALIVPVPVS
jgi:hypothetical protein